MEIKILNRYVYFLPNIQFSNRYVFLILKNWQNDQWSQCHSIQMPLMLLLLCIFNEKVKVFFHKTVKYVLAKYDQHQQYVSIFYQVDNEISTVVFYTKIRLISDVKS